MATLKGNDGKPCLAVGTKSGVHRFGRDCTLKGRVALASVAFAGPGGKNRDRVSTVDSRGEVRVLILK